MWTQYWVVPAESDEAAQVALKQALLRWVPEGVASPEIRSVRFYRGPDDLALTEALAIELAEIRQTVASGHREELSRRLQQLSHRALGIPPRAGWVVLDENGPRSPRPLDCRTPPYLRWVVTLEWDGDEPEIGR